MTRRFAFACVVLAVAVATGDLRVSGYQRQGGPAAAVGGGAQASGDREWRTYGGDLANTRYAPLDQINAGNFNQLELAWRFRTDSLGPRPENNYETTPLMVGGVVYATAGSRRDVVALDAATGELLWIHREDEGKRGSSAPRQLSGRGLAYWSDGQNARVVYVTPGYRLISLDAKTGVPAATFGKDGVVDLKLDDDQDMDLTTGEIGLHATPIVTRDTIIVGAAHLEGGAPKHRNNQKGYVRAFDARSGKRLWIFHTIPLKGEFGYETWEDGSAEHTGNAGVWTQMSVDEELGLVYMPVELPTGDYFGGHRPGSTLFGESLVAVDIRTGRRKWHYQMVHHGIWDMDLPCAPVLADVMIDGRMRKIAAQPSKQGWLYVLDRATGEPIWPIEERPVAQSDVPFEKTSRTQPFVSKPPAFERQGVSIDDLIDFTPELRAEAVKLVSRFKIGPIFTPPVVSKWDGALGTLFLPNSTGGANWPGASYDPQTGILYIYSKTEVGTLGLRPGEEAESDMAFVRGQATNPDSPKDPPVLLNVRGLPLIKPPYGSITAIDLKSGEIVWRIAHGETPDEIRNHPALKGLTIPRTGRIGRIGTLTTSSLVIAGEGGMFTTPNGRRGAMLRAYDKKTGSEVGAVYMPAPQTGSPMTYVHNGRQYIVLAVSAPNYGAELLAFRLPS
jgi:quinoprotein glucose dehydrogenase